MTRLILLIIFISNSLFAQNKVKETYTVYINYPDYTVKASVFSEQKKVTTKDTLTYHWYTSNKILKTQGGFDGKLLNGSYTSFYITNNLKEKGNFRNGLKVGVWNTWFENGKLKEVSCWKNGVKNGELKAFSEKGVLLKEMNFKSGRLHGDYFEYSKDTISLKKKFKNGEELIVKEKVKKIKSKGESKNAEKVKDEKTIEKKRNGLFKKKNTSSEKVLGQELESKTKDKPKKEKKVKNKTDNNEQK